MRLNLGARGLRARLFCRFVVLESQEFGRGHEPIFTIKDVYEIQQNLIINNKLLSHCRVSVCETGKRLASLKTKKGEQCLLGSSHLQRLREESGSKAWTAPPLLMWETWSASDSS